MNERNLSRRLSTQVVDALKTHGHILVVKGGVTALARELDDLMTPEVATIEPRLQPYVVLVGEPTSTFGDEAVDQAVEDMVDKLTHALMSSDHVEDVFAEDAVIRRDIFRVVRDGLRERPDDAHDDDDETMVTVKLDMLGYVAATASRRAEPSILRQALDRAASFAGAHFSGFSAELREATFRLDAGGEDERLELEEAVADELTDLVEHGVVELPTIERRIDLGRPLAVAEHKSMRARVASAADATLLGAGCAATWDVPDPRTIRVLFTPLSDQDAEAVDAPMSAFAREIAAILATPTAPNGDANDATPRARVAADQAPPARGAPSSSSPGSIKSPGSSKSPTSAKAPVSAKAPASSKPAKGDKTPASSKVKKPAALPHASSAGKPASKKKKVAPKTTAQKAKAVKPASPKPAAKKSAKKPASPAKG